MILRQPLEVERLILESAAQANVLPITSGCDSHCVFCSHNNNPLGVAVASIGRRSLTEIARTLAFLKPDRVITIGESATPIIEGEPFTHPDLAEILALVRRALPDTPVEITTNGRFLTRRVIEMLEGLGSVTLNVSLNSASVRGRQLLMGDSAEEAERAIIGVRLLGQSTVHFTGSLVVMPNLVGWEDVRDTVSFLAANGATAVRVIVPAYSALADAGLFPDESIHARTREFVEGMSQKSRCPVLIEPSCVSDLMPVVSGVLRDSAAWQAGLRAGDVFLEINGKKPRSRVEAWQMLLARDAMVVSVTRGGRTLALTWPNEREGEPAITVEYDFDPERAENVRRLAAKGGGKSLLLTSELGHGVVKAVLHLFGLDAQVAEAITVKNRTFGGTIRASGLLTVGDYAEAYAGWRDHHDKPAQIVLPEESFDFQGNDLTRRHFSELRELTGVRVVLG